MSADGVLMLLLNSVGKLTKKGRMSTHAYTTAAAEPRTLMTWKQKYVNSSPNPIADFFSALKEGAIWIEPDGLT